MSRSRADATIDAQIKVGDKDVMSQLARRANLPTCSELPCTRAAGHNESKEGHAGSLHVHADARGVVKKVWP